MEAIFLVCGAGGPQLKRNPLGCTHKTMSLLSLLEVMDKEVTVREAWLLAGLCTGVGYLISRRWRWLVAVPLLVLLDSVWRIAAELRDPLVGAAIRLEAGSEYPLFVYLPHALAGLALVGFFVTGAHRKRRAA